MQVPPPRKGPLPALGRGASTRSLRGQAAVCVGLAVPVSGVHPRPASPSASAYVQTLADATQSCLWSWGKSHALFITQFFSFGKTAPDALLWPLDIRPAAPRLRHFLWPDHLGHTSKVRPARRAPHQVGAGRTAEGQTAEGRPPQAPAGELSQCPSFTVPFPGYKDAPPSSCSSCLRGNMSLFCGSLEMTVFLVLFCPRILQSVEMRRLLLRPEIFIKTFIQQRG